MRQTETEPRLPQNVQSAGASRIQCVGQDVACLLRADDEVYHFKVDQYSLRTLYPRYLEKNVEFYELKLSSGHELRSAPHLDGTMEFVTVQQGEIDVTSGDQKSRLGAGDSAHYLADVPHAVQNVGDGEAIAFLVAVYKTD